MPGPPRVDTARLMELLAVSLGAYYGDFTAAGGRGGRADPPRRLENL
ncbi:hypothetical protein [Streptomyces lasiicapitis]